MPQAGLTANSERFEGKVVHRFSVSKRAGKNLDHCDSTERQGQDDLVVAVVIIIAAEIREYFVEIEFLLARRVLFIFGER